MAQDPEILPEDTPQPNSGGHLMLMGILLLAPFALLIAKLGEYGLPFPYWDAWRFVDVLQKADAGTLGFVDLWAQHNEHRILFPKLLMLVLAQFSGWNVWWEIGASVFFALLMFTALVGMLLRAVGTDTTLRCTGAALISALLFSWTQSESWVWGFQSNAWLCLAAVVLGVTTLSSGLRFPVRIGLGVLCGIIATYSYANGLFYWVAALPLLWDLRLAREARIGGVIVWCAAAALVAQSYFFGYVQPEVSPSLLTAFEHPALFVQFLAAMLGAPVSTFLTEPAWHGVNVAVPVWAMLPGPLAVALSIYLAWRSWRAERDLAVLAPWLALAAFALGSALVASAGRSGLGLGQALTSRYIPITSLFWFALIALWLRALSRSPWWEDARTRSVLVGACAVAILGGLAGASTTSASHEQRCHWKQMGWLSIRLGMPEAIFLRDLSDTPEALATTILPWLKETQRCGLDTPPPDPKQYAPRFAQDAEQLIAMGLMPPAKVYLDVAARLDPDLPEVVVLRAKLPQKGQHNYIPASSTPFRAGGAAVHYRGQNLHPPHWHRAVALEARRSITEDKASIPHIGTAPPRWRRGDPLPRTKPPSPTLAPRFRAGGAAVHYRGQNLHPPHWHRAFALEARRSLAGGGAKRNPRIRAAISKRPSGAQVYSHHIRRTPNQYPNSPNTCRPVSVISRHPPSIKIIPGNISSR